MKFNLFSWNQRSRKETPFPAGKTQGNTNVSADTYLEDNEEVVQPMTKEFEEVKVKVRPEIKFTTYSEMNGSRFEVDPKNSISKVYWNGIVNVDTASKMLSYGADSVEFKGYRRLIVNRSDLIEFNTEARVWIKGLLKSRAKAISHKVEKLAIINAKTARGSIFSNLIATAIRLVMPGLNMKKFDNEESAIDWLLS